MIKLVKSGIYKLIDTKQDTRILYIGRRAFAWIMATGIGEILVSTHAPHKTDSLLSAGTYNLYAVKDEPKLVDELHLELEVGRGIWQGYLLPTGLPSSHKARSRIIPTKELITKHTPHVSITPDAVRAFNHQQILALGKAVGIDFKVIKSSEFHQGLLIELEHGAHDTQTNVTDNDLYSTAKIAWAHLKEIPDYYTRLHAMEAAAGS